MEENKNYDVVIIGGSYAGLSAAMGLGRAIRKTLVIDSGKPCNAQTPHSHNLITQDGVAPAVIAAAARTQVSAYPTVDFLAGKAVDISGEDLNFVVKTEDGRSINTKKIIFATGVKDIMPAIPGFAECWGISVIHCPYCHGYEYKGEHTGILMNGEMAADMAELIDNWTDKLTVFTNGTSTIPAARAEKLKAHGIKITEEKISSFVHHAGQLEKVEFSDGSFVQLDAIYARPPFVQHSDLPAQLGCGLTEMGHLIADDFKKTTVPGIYAAGDNITMFRSVAAAIAGGSMAAAAINHEMIAEKFGKH